MYRQDARPYGAPWPGVDEADHQEALRASLALVGCLGGGALGAWVVAQGPSVRLWPRTVTAALAPEWGGLLVRRRVAVHRWGGGHVCGSGCPDRALGAGHRVQSAAARRLEVSGIATSYITGTVTTLAAWLMRWLGGGGATASTRPQAGMVDSGAPRQARRAVGRLAAVWGMSRGGAMGAGACGRLGLEVAVRFPVALMLIVMVTAAVHWPP